MQVHGPGGEAHGPLRVTLNTTAVNWPFAVIYLAGFQVFLQSPADCDELITAAAEAKRLLLAAAGDSGPGQVTS